MLRYDMQISILNLNLWLLPPPMAAENGKRLQEFLELTRKLNPDIITLQEVWIKPYVGFLKRNLPDYYLSSSKSHIYNKSGLVTLSKLKPISSVYVPFPKYIGTKHAESLARKGYLKTIFNINEKEITLFNTHFHATYSSNGEGRKVAETQFKFLKQAVEDEKFAIVSGDLNIPPKMFMKLNQGYFKFGSDVYEPQLDIKYMNRRANKYFSNHFGTKTDYVLVRESDKVSLNSKVIQNPEISDHLAILSTIALKF